MSKNKLGALFDVKQLSESKFENCSYYIKYLISCHWGQSIRWIQGISYETINAWDIKCKVANLISSGWILIHWFKIRFSAHFWEKIYSFIKNHIYLAKKIKTIQNHCFKEFFLVFSFLLSVSEFIPGWIYFSFD